MEGSTILTAVTAGAAVMAMLGVLFLHVLPGPNKLRQELTERLASTEKRVADLELKVASEHPVFLERLGQLGIALAQNTTALERLGTEFHAFARNFRGSGA